MSLEDEVVAEYKNGLDILTNQRTAISNLSIIAKENELSATGIVGAISERIKKETSQDKRITFLYLIDQIAKTSKGNMYHTMLSENIYELFCSAYVRSSIEARKALVHLYDTWEGVFSKEILLKISMELNLDMQRIILFDDMTRQNIPLVEIDRKVAEDKSKLLNRKLFEPCEVRDEQAVYSLHEGRPLLCNKCGMRFGDDERTAFAKHLDFHFYFDSRIDMTDGSLKISFSRVWNMPREEWIVDTTSSDFKEEIGKSLASFRGILGVDEEESAIQVAEEQIIHTAITEELLVCPVCNERFDIYWDDAADAWKVKQSVWMKENVLCHSHCAKEVQNAGFYSGSQKVDSGSSSYAKSVVIRQGRKRRRF